MSCRGVPKASPRVSGSNFKTWAGSFWPGVCGKLPFADCFSCGQPQFRRGQRRCAALRALAIDRRIRPSEAVGQESRSCKRAHGVGESDDLSGLVVDRFVLTTGRVVYVVQAQTAGAESWLVGGERTLSRRVSRMRRSILRRDASVRKLEGLETVETPELALAAGLSAEALIETAIVVPAVGAKGTLVMTTNLWSGQKTGYFLDQFANIGVTAELLARLVRPTPELRILDLFSFVGQWSAQLAHFSRTQLQVPSVSTVIVDASRDALAFAARNAEAAGASAKTVELDIVEKLRDWTPPRGKGADPEYFDVIVVDPPALIKTRKAHGPGKHAYVQVNSAALEFAKSGTLFVSCSCSALLSDHDFTQVLSKAQARTGRKLRLIARGGPALDHPLLAQFPEGHYLKAWIGIVE